MRRCVMPVRRCLAGTVLVAILAAGAGDVAASGLAAGAGDVAASGLAAGAGDVASSGRPERPDPRAGKALAEDLCGRCHATGPTGDSPLPQAVPFRDLRTRYPVESLAEALAEGIVTGHEDMPEFRFEPRAIDDLLAWLGTLDGTPGDVSPGTSR